MDDISNRNIKEIRGKLLSELCFELYTKGIKAKSEWYLNYFKWAGSTKIKNTVYSIISGYSKKRTLPD